MVVLAGRILVFLGTLHLVLLLARSAGRFDDWFGGAMWFLQGEAFFEPSGAASAFWISLGSFALPLLLLGLLVSYLGKTGVPVPRSIGWGLALWGAVCAVVVVPTPMPLVLVPAVMLIRRKTAVAGPKAG